MSCMHTLIICTVKSDECKLKLHTFFCLAVLYPADRTTSPLSFQCFNLFNMFGPFLYVCACMPALFPCSA